MIKFIIISWFLIGLLCAIDMIILDMRNKPYNEEKFYLSIYIFIFLFGYVSFAISIFSFIEEKKINIKRFFKKLLYKIANIGIKDKGEE